MTYEGFRGGFHLFKRLGMTYRFSEEDLKTIVKTTLKVCIVKDKKEEAPTPKLPRIGSRISFISYLGNAIVAEGIGVVNQIDLNLGLIKVLDTASGYTEAVRIGDLKDVYRILDY